MCVATPELHEGELLHHAGGQWPSSKRCLTKLCLRVETQSDQLCVHLGQQLEQLRDDDTWQCELQKTKNTPVCGVVTSPKDLGWKLGLSCEQEKEWGGGVGILE